MEEACLPTAAVISESVTAERASASASRRGVACAAPRGDEAAWRARPGQRLTVATWNVEWLFDGIADPPMRPWQGAAEGAARRAARVAGVLRQVDADIIHFAEVETCGVLSAVGQELNGGHEPYLIEGTDTALQQQVGLLSRLRPLDPLRRSEATAIFPLDGSACGAGRPGRTGVSKHLVVRFSPVERHNVTLIGLHLKAFPNKPDACHQREGQAHVVQGLVREALSVGDHVMVLGDLNDLDPDLRDPSGKTPSSRVLRMIKDADNDGVPDLVNLMERLPVNDRFSSWWDGDGDKAFDKIREGSLIDHILISRSLTPMVEAVGIEHGHDPTQISDHWPLWVRFDLTSWHLRPLTSGEEIPPELAAESIDPATLGLQMLQNLLPIPVIAVIFLGRGHVRRFLIQHFSKKTKRRLA